MIFQNWCTCANEWFLNNIKYFTLSTKCFTNFYNYVEIRCTKFFVLGIYDYKEFLTTSSNYSYYFYINTGNDSVVKKALGRFAQFFIEVHRWKIEWYDLRSPFLCCSWIEEKIWIMDSKLEKELYDTAWFPYFERSMTEITHPYSKYGLCKKKILEEL